MILYRLEHASQYGGLGKRIATALAFLQRPETAALEPGALGSENSRRIDIEGDEIFALVQRYHTRLMPEARGLLCLGFDVPHSADEPFWEAHRKYIDVQYVVEGAETMGHAPLNSMRIVKPYDDQKDFTVLAPMKNASVNFIRVDAGMFAIFMPHDAHMPGLAVNQDSAVVKKIVVKVKAN